MGILGLNKTIGRRKGNHQKNRNLSGLIVGTTRIWMARETIPNNQVGSCHFWYCVCFYFLVYLRYLSYLCNLLYISYLCYLLYLLYLLWQRFGLTCGIVQRSYGFWDTDSALVSRMISLKDTLLLTGRVYCTVMLEYWTSAIRWITYFTYDFISLMRVIVPICFIVLIVLILL